MAKSYSFVAVCGAGVLSAVLSGGCSTSTAAVADASTDAGDASVASSKTLLLGLTLHLENKTFDSAYFASLDSFAKTFEAHNGRLTFEPRNEVVTAAAGPPLMLDWKGLEARGHSVGSHAAIGGVDAIPLEQFSSQAKMRYELLKPKVNRLDHISGNCGNVDWVKGVTDVGFVATTAATVLCLYSMPAENRPAEYKNLSCTGSTDPTCHASYPKTVAERIHPWRAGSSANWLTDDPAGKLVIFPGSGTLPCLEEEATSPGKGLPTCTFTQEDVTRALADLDAAIALTDANKINTFYWVWGSWSISAAEQPVLETFLKEVDKRIAKGEVKWAGVGTMLDTYKEWEKTHR